MIFSYNWIQSFLKKKLPSPEKLSGNLLMHIFEVDEVKKSGNDWILDIDILANRADCFSHLGIAGECGAIFNSPVKFPETLKKDKRKTGSSNFSVEVKGENACRRYMARFVGGIEVGSSPKYIKERLSACGLKSINNIVDIANYVMLETGQPLHVFDAEKIKGGKIIVRFAKKGEEITTLDSQKIALSRDVLVIADEGDPVAIAGIKGGKIPEVSGKTKNIIIESANFNQRNIRIGSRKTGLRTDASLRFEHGLDPNLAELAISRAAFLMQKEARGEARKLVDFYPKKALANRVKLEFNYLERLLGIKISASKAKSILKRLNFKIIKSSSASIIAESPPFRQDIFNQEDLIEEIGRIYGYGKIKSEMPFFVLIPPKRNEGLFWENMAKDALKGFGFSESYNYSFVKEEDARNFNLKNLIEVSNPLTEDQRYLRSSLAPNLFKNIKENSRNEKNIKLFEIGKVFSSPNEERKYLCAAMPEKNFYKGKGIVEELLGKLGISGVSFVEDKEKGVKIKIGNKEIGVINIKGGILYFETDFDCLADIASEEHEYRPISKFPSAVRDIAVLVPRNTKVANVLNVINSAGGSLVRDIDLFDVYEGEKIPFGRKNLAFHIVYQAKDKTLSSEEIDVLQEKIIKALEKNPRWEVRKLK